MKNDFIVRIIHKIKRLTLLDWIVCAVLLGLLGYFLVNRFAKQEQWVNVRLKISGEEWWWNPGYPENWYGANLSKDQSAYNSFGKKVAQIQSVENYDAGKANRLIFVNLRLLTTYDKNTRTYTFNYQPLQIGKPMDLTFHQQNVRGLVTYVGNNLAPYTDTTLEVKLLAAYPWEADSLIKGLQMKDLGGNVIATINEVNITDAQVLEIRDKYGKLIALPAPYNTYRDVTLKVTLKTYAVNNTSFFVDGSAIKVGNKIWIEFEHTAIKDAIISKVF